VSEAEVEFIYIGACPKENLREIDAKAKEKDGQNINIIWLHVCTG